ncbi:sialate O-acetylesterase [Echinicola marina]|uniref:sialate O-acetylesterase n=1 Tax=Echinicola marina TaxID=2859768 RepID=UPI001CF6A7FF|nr:sialate O-acetylesterase [Echinicola marina]UCS93352.1 sialate O-acetylesterase [Echinicola marina]
MKNYLKPLMIIGFLFVSMLAHAKVSLPHFFSDNMVLQRDKVIKIWGKSSPKEKVTVRFNGEERQVVAGKGGMWRVSLPAMAYGGPFEMSIEGNENNIVLKNILIGDVWLCSGQSNMEFGLNGDLTGKEEIQQSKNSNIRLLNVPKTIQTSETYDIEESSWQECGPSTTANFSAVGYFFGKKLQADLDVPIGLINSSWGGTDIETWTSWEASMNNEEYAKYAGQSVEKTLGYSTEDLDQFKQSLENDPAIKKKWYDSDTKLKGWKKMMVPKSWDGEYEDEDGIIWFRKKVTLPKGVEGMSGELNLGPIDDADITWVNGTKVGATDFWMANRNYKIAPDILKAGENTIMVSVKDNTSVGGINGKPEDVYLKVGDKKYPLAGEWDYKPSVTSSGYGFSKWGTGPNSFASLLYNGMIHPLVGFGIKGVIWYQGENNAGEAYRYRKLFPNMIKDWRAQWEDDFAFLWVQLASFMAIDEKPSESEWAELREAQNMTLALPKTGQAVITDIGEAFDIHPRNKKDVGIRLAHTALNVAYGKDVLPSGPVFEKLEKQGKQMVLSFSHIGRGLSTQDSSKYAYVKGFAIAGEDKEFVWAQAYISGEKVIVWSDKVEDPVAVRYGWANNPMEINLVNSDGLLASPFRTDNWKGITEDNKPE